jgi:hypothetical protein
MAPIPYISTTSPDDAGQRPIAAGVQWWLTPAMTIVGKPANQNQDPSIAVADVAQTVRVLVSNNSPDAGDVTVQVWANNFGTTATGFFGSLGGATGRQTEITLAGSTTSVQVDFPWTPQGVELPKDPQTNLPIPVHCCLQANVFVSARLQDKLATPNAPQFDVNSINRHAQHNATVVPKPITLRKMSFPFLIANPFEEFDGPFTVEVEEIHTPLLAVERTQLRLAGVLGRGGHHGGHEHEDREERRHAEVGARGRGGHGNGGDGDGHGHHGGGDGDGHGHHDDDEVQHADRRNAARGLGVEDPEGEGPAGKQVDVRIAPGDQRFVDLEFELPPDRERRLVHRFDIFQRAGDRLVGAARVITLNVPDEDAVPGGGIG